MNSPAETVQEMYAAFARGEIETVLELLDADVGWLTPTLPWSRGSYEGRGAVAEYLGAFAEALDLATLEPQEMVDSGERVVAMGRESGTSRATGRRFTVPFAHAITVRDGRVVELQGYLDTALIADTFAADGVASDVVR